MGSYKRTWASVVLCLGLLAAGAGAGVRFVDDNAPPGGDGTSWNTAFRYLQDALFITGPGDEVHVAGGVYWPDRDEAGYLTPGDRHAAFWLLDGEVVRGGYAGYGATYPNARDFLLYETVLSGDLLGDDEPGFVNLGDNSFHVVDVEGGGLGAIVDGLTIRGGNADGGYPDDRGGGLLALAASPYVLHCTFNANRAVYGGAAFAGNDSFADFTGCAFHSNAASTDGGALYIGLRALPLIHFCTFEANTASVTGGALFLDDDSFLLLAECTLIANQAPYGGAIGADACAPHFVSCAFVNNAATPYSGGAVFNFESASAAFDECTFSGNTAQTSGGAVWNDPWSVVTFAGCEFSANAAVNGGAVANWHGVQATLTDCVFNNNVASGDGGAVLNDWDSFATLARCTFTQNTANYGGGINNWGTARVDMTDCQLTQNHATYHGGGLNSSGNDAFLRCRWEGNSADSRGAGAANWNGTLTFTDCEFVSNAAVDLAGGLLLDHSQATLENCTFRQNSAGNAGGGVFSCCQSTLESTDCTFEQNTAPWGAGLSNDNLTSGTLTRCHFLYNNSSAGGGGGLSGWQSSPVLADCNFVGNTGRWGGGFRNIGGQSAPTLTNCLFTNNYASENGGGVGTYDGSHPTFTLCQFQGNSAATCGGGLNSWSSQTTLANCTFQNNTANVGGGVYSGNGALTMTRGWLRGNTGQSGGALFLYNCVTQLSGDVYAGNQAQGGGALYALESPVTLTNCTLTQNTGLSHGGALWGEGDSTNIILTNCIAWENPPDSQASGAFQVTASHCDIEAVWAGQHNFQSDPRFVDPATDFHLQPDSPCFERGDDAAPLLPELDLDGEPRIQQCRVDIGADESPYVLDCNANGMSDCTDIAQGSSLDCNGNDIPDECDLAAGTSPDCNLNAVPDECDIAAGVSLDCNNNGLPDECDLAQGDSQDCNANGIPDECDLASGTSEDCYGYGNGIPDECEPDCNQNAVADTCDITLGVSLDCNDNAVPDECDLANGSATDFNGNNLLDECEGLGDLNCDELVDFDDIVPFVMALSDPAMYALAFPGCDIQLANCNGDAWIDFDDIIPFVALLSGR